MLLCEGCGYVLDGSPRDGPCPECGRPVRDSLPECRPGTPWQQKRGAKTWEATLISMIIRPVATMAALRVPVGGPISKHATVLLTINCGMIPVGFMPPAIIGGQWNYVWLLLGLWLLLVALTEIEAIGLRFIGRRRGWRVSWALSREICAHASFAWLLLMPTACVAVAVTHWFKHNDLGVPRTIANAVGWSMWFLPTMLCFETLAYLGVRACKFANADVHARGNAGNDAATKSPDQESTRP